MNWPAVIQEDLHRSPHGDPTDDDQAFLGNCYQRAGTKLQQIAGQQQAACQKCQSNSEVHPAFAQQFTLAQGILFGAVIEIIPGRITDIFLVTLGQRRFQQMDLQQKLIGARSFPGPGNDKFLCVDIEVFLAER